MGVLASLERALRGLFEGLSGRTFGGTLQPQELLRRIATELITSEHPGPDGPLVANAFGIELSQGDYRVLQPELAAVTEESLALLASLCRERGFTSAGPFEVRFTPGARLASGQIRVDRRVRPGAPFVRVEAVSGPDRGRVFSGAARDVTIGRDPECTICLSDRDVSRRHAMLRSLGDRLLVEDLGSTNGTYVGGRTVTVRELSDSEAIEMGATILRVARTGIAWDAETPAGVAAASETALP
jgi:hypothetical protein